MRIFALLLLAGTAHAQTVLTAGPYVAASSNAGLESPIAGIQTALRTRHSRFELVARGNYFPRYVKAYSGDGRAYSIEADLRIFGGRFFIAPGFLRTTAHFDQTSRTSTHLSLGGGYSRDSVTISGYYRLPDRTRYRLSSIGGRVDWQKPVSERLVFVLSPGLDVFRYEFEGNQTGVKPSISAGFGVRL